MTSTAPRETEDTLFPVPEQVRLYRAAPAQERMWFAHEQSPEDRSYNVFLAFSVTGFLDVGALRDAVSDVVRAHEPLRTTFRHIDGLLHQLVAESVPTPFTVHACDTVEGPEVRAQLAARATEPFDLRRGPVFRVDLFSSDAATHVLLLSMHHIVTDGRSLGIVCDDIAEAYGRRLAGEVFLSDEELPQFGDYCEMLAEAAEGPDAQEGGIAYWRSILSPLPKPLQLPLDRLRPAVQQPEAERLSFRLGSDTSSAIRAVARREGVPLSSVALASYMLVLAAWTEEAEFIVGMPASGRTDDEVMDMVGLFVNILPVRLEVPRASKGSHLLRSVASRLTEAVDHEETPLEKIVEAVSPPRSPGRNPLFDALFTAQNTSDVSLGLPRARTSVMDVDTSWTRHDLELNVWSDEPEIRFMLVARRSLFELVTVEALVSAIRRTAAALAYPGQSVEELLETARPDVPSPQRPSRPQSEALERIRGLPGVTGTALARCVSPDGAPRQTALVSSSTPLTEARVFHAAGPETSIDSVALINALPARPDGRLDLSAVEATVLGQESTAEWDSEAGRAAQVSMVSAPAAPRARRQPPPAISQVTSSAEQHLPATAPGAQMPLSVASGGPAPELPHHDLAEALARAAATDRGTTLVEESGRTTRIGYTELYAAAQKIATRLRRTAPSHSPLVLAFRTNTWLLPRLWGCILAGLPAMPWVPPLDEDDLPGAMQEVLGLLGDAAILAEGPLAHFAGPAAESAGPGVLYLRDERHPPDGKDTEDRSRLPSDSPGGSSFPPSDRDSDALLLRTSGSTRTPKAVRLTHRQILTRSAGSAVACGLSDEEVSLNWMPLDHVGGVVMFHIRDVVLGFEQVQVATHYVLAEPARWMRLCAKHGVTTTWAPNFAFGLAVRAAERLAAEGIELHMLRHILNGGEAVRRSTVVEFLRSFTPLGLPEDAVRPSWGMSETGSGQTDSARCTIAELSSGDGPVPVGRLYPGFSIRVVDESGDPVPEGEEGRLEVSGHSVTPGYHRDQERTAEAFTEDGWFVTGDLATFRDGELSIIGRAKDTVIIHGLNFACEEIEVEVESRCTVRPSCSAAFSLPLEGTDTEQLCVATVPETDSPKTSAELAEEIREATRRVTGHPATVFFLAEETIPRTTIGKIMRAALRQQLREGALRAEQHSAPVPGEDGSDIFGGVPDWFFVPSERPALDFDPRSNPALVSRPSVNSALVLTIGTSPIHESLVSALELLGVATVPAPSPSLSWATLSRETEPGRTGVTEADTVLLLLGKDPEEDPTGRILRLTQAIGHLAVQLSQAASATGRRRELVVVSHSAGMTSREEWAESGARGAISGLLRSLSGELPEVNLRLIRADGASAGATAREVVVGEESVSLRRTHHGESRTCKALEPLTGALDETNLPPTGGCFVIAGGTGEIGLSLAEYLLSERDATVLLLGRKERRLSNEDHRDPVAVLSERHGASRVHVMAADVTDRKELAAAVARFESRTGRAVQGAFHCAGGFSESVFADVDDAMLRKTMEAKVAGALHLIDVLKERASPFLIFCSSVSGYLGAPMAASYAAANSFLDELALNAADSSVRCRSIAWSMWRETGLSRGFAHPGRAAERGTLVLEPATAAASWPIVLSSSEPLILVGLDETRPLIGALLNPPGQGRRALELDGDPEQFGVPSDVLGRRVPVVRKEASGSSENATPASAAPPGRRGEIERRISAHWQDVLALPKVERTASFFDLGGTSIHLSQVHERLREELDPKLTLSQLFQLHTVAELSAHLARRTSSAPPEDSSESSHDRSTTRTSGYEESTPQVSKAAARGRERAARRRRRSR